MVEKTAREGDHARWIELIAPEDFDAAVRKLRGFFQERGFIEGHFQHRLSPLGILAACENPFNIATFDYAGQVWPLPQTSQMWLEYELLNNPSAPGFFSVSTSFRQEPEPIEGRHNLIFPMVEFETHGGIESLISLEHELLLWLRFPGTASAEEGVTSYGTEIRYEEAMRRYNVREIGNTEEGLLWKEFGPVVFLKFFPRHTSPFWNMRHDGENARKVDVILYGVETIGSAERSIDAEEMRHNFYTISNGAYAKTLFAKFTRERVERELEFFLSLPFFPRSGGGIGMTRLIRALKLAGKL